MSLKKLFNHTMSILVHGAVFRILYFVQAGTNTPLEKALVSFGIIWLIMLFVLVLFKIQCNIPFPAKALRIRSFESGGFYPRLGIRVYRWLLIKGPFRFANSDVYLKRSRGREALKRVLSKMKEAELAHWVNVVLVLISTVFYTNIIWWLLGWNVIFNIYPIFLQRWHRLRIEPLLEPVN